MRFALLPLATLAAACATPEAATPPVPEHAAHAWATFDAAGIRASGAEGLADRASGRALTIEDPVRIASITKLVVALGALRLAEEGKLDLDRDVSHWLGWRLRNPAFADRPLTMRMLLSHTSSLTDEAEYVIPLGETVQAKLHDPRAFDAAHPPGTYFRYSNLNFPVAAGVMEAASGERFDRLMERLVLKPLELDACFNWTTCSDEAIDRAVILYAPDGEIVRDELKGERPACPVVPAADGSCDLAPYPLATNGALFAPQGGLRISVAGLAKIGRMLLRDGRLDDGSTFLPPSRVAELTRPVWRYREGTGEKEGGFYCGYGLAVQILAQCAPDDDPFGDGRPRVGHAGDAYHLKSGLWIDPERGTGIAYFATGVPAPAPKGRSAWPAIEEWLAAKGG